MRSTIRMGRGDDLFGSQNGSCVTEARTEAVWDEVTIYLEVRTEAVLRKPGRKLCYLDSQFSRLNKQCFVCFNIFNFQDLINSVSFL